MPDLAAQITALETALAIVDELTGVILRPSVERILLELSQDKPTQEEVDQAIAILAEQARAAGDERRVAYLEAFRQGLVGRPDRVPGIR